MTAGSALLFVHPPELKFPIELKKRTSCSMKLISKSDQHVAFKVKTTNRERYKVRPCVGILLPGTSCNVTVTMLPLNETPRNMLCKDKFLVQSTIVPSTSSFEDISPDMFNKESGSCINEFKLRVAYIPANPLSPNAEQTGNNVLLKAFTFEDADANAVLHDAVSRSFEAVEDQFSSLDDAMEKENNRSCARVLHLLFAMLIAVLGILVFYSFFAMPIAILGVPFGYIVVVVQYALNSFHRSSDTAWSLAF